MTSATMTLEKAYEITGNRCEAWLYRYFSFWQPKAKAEKNGLRWVVCTIKELISRGCMWSERTIKGAMASLVKKGLLVKTHSRHPFVSGVLRACWVRVSNGAKTAPLIGQKLPHQSGKNCPTHIQEGHQEEEQEVQADKPQGSKKFTYSKIGGMSSESIKEAHKPKPPKPKGKLKPSLLFQYIRSIQAEEDPDHPIGDQTGKALGNCKTILSRFREAGYEDQQILDTLQKVISKWAWFREYMETQLAYKNVPDFVILPFLTTNVSRMISFDQWSADKTDSSDVDWDSMFN